MWGLKKDKGQLKNMREGRRQTTLCKNKIQLLSLLQMHFELRMVAPRVQTTWSFKETTPKWVL